MRGCFDMQNPRPSRSGVGAAQDGDCGQRCTLQEYLEQTKTRGGGGVCSERVYV